MNPKGLAKTWAEVIGPDLQDDERKLITEVSNFIVGRWAGRATDTDVFNDIYKGSRRHAQGLVVAIIEAARAVADGKDPKEKMLEGLTRGQEYTQ